MGKKEVHLELSGDGGDILQEIVLVTGASSGIGEATARKFAQGGAKVVLWARREDRLKQLTTELGERAHYQVVDVTDKGQVQAAVKNLPPEFKDITILVNSAGAAHGREKAQDASMQDWEGMVDLNIKGVLFATHAILPGLLERNRGHILNVGSVAGRYPYAGGSVYGATKAFLEQFSLNLRSDVLGKQVRITNIEPGAVHTEFSMVRFKGDQKASDAVYQGITPLTGGDIAETIFWSASLPPHVNINRIEVMPTDQAFAGFSFDRKPAE